MPLTTSLANAFWASKSGSRNFPRCISLGQCLNDLLPVEAPVFDEYLAGVPPADDHPRQVDSGHIALQRIGIQRRPAALRIELHPEALDERKVRVISGERSEEHTSELQSHHDL